MSYNSPSPNVRSPFSRAVADRMASSEHVGGVDDQPPSKPQGNSPTQPSMALTHQTTQDTVELCERDKHAAEDKSDASASSHQSSPERQTAQQPVTPVTQKPSRSNNTIKITATVAADQNNTEPAAAMVESIIRPTLPAKSTAAVQESPYGSDRSKGSTAVDLTASSSTSPCQSPSPNRFLDKQPLAGKEQSSDKRPPSGQEDGQSQPAVPGSPGRRKDLDVEVFMKHAMAGAVTEIGVDVDLEDYPRPSVAEIQQYKQDLKEALKLAPSDRIDRKYNHLMDMGEDVDEKLAIAEKQFAQMLSEDKFRKLDLAPQVYLRNNCCSINCKCPPCWSRFPSCKEEEAALASSTLYVILRNMPNATGTGWDTSEIVIRGQDMKDALKDVFGGYPGFDTRLMGEGDWVFKAPFMPFVHRWNRLAAHPFHWNGEHDIDTTHELERQYILDSIASAMERHFKELELIKETREVRFEDLWLLYAPDTIVVTELLPTGSTKLRLPEAVRVVSCTPVMTGCDGKTRVEAWQVKSDVHVCDGDTVGWCTETWTIPHFEGYRRVDALGPYFPMEYHPHAIALVKELHSRGKKAFESCLKFRPMWSLANNPVMDSTGELHKGPPGSRMVMVDVDGLYKHCQTMARPHIHTKSDLLRKPNPAGEQHEDEPAWDEVTYEKGTLDTKESSLRDRQDACADGKADRKDNSKGHQAIHRSDPDQRKSDSSHNAKDNRGEDLLTARTVKLPGAETLYFDEAWYSSEYPTPIEGPIIPEYLLSRGYLGGFDLATKQWCQFSATDLNPVYDNHTDMHAIDKLYPGHQHIGRIAELVRRKVDRELNAADPKVSLDDPRRDLKFYLARALTFLIAGPSGVGKTATVHAIAHMNRTAVWETTVDELCSSPGGFQQGLETALNLCERMNFLFLLEDADSLACHDANCKDHVAAMLQVLNRTPCVVFLTANNFDLIPHNLRSRCDKIVQLPELSRNTRRRAWLKAFKEQGITRQTLNSTQLDTALNMAEKPKLNGHEIVNLVKQVPMRAIAGFNCDGDNYVNELGRMIGEVSDAKAGLGFASLKENGRKMRNKENLNGRQKENLGAKGKENQYLRSKENQYLSAKENQYPMQEHEYQTDEIVEETDGYEEFAF